MELFTGRTPSPMLLCPMPLKSYLTLQALNNEKIHNIIDTKKSHEAPDNVHRIVAIRKEQDKTRARQEHNAETQVLPLNMNIRDFVMVRVNSKTGHDIHTKLKRTVRVMETKSHLLFVVEDINRQHKMIVRAQRLVPFLVTGKHL